MSHPVCGRTILGMLAQTIQLPIKEIEKNNQQYAFLNMTSSSNASRFMVLRILLISNASIHKCAVGQRQKAYWNASGFHAPSCFRAN